MSVNRSGWLRGVRLPALAVGVAVSVSGGTPASGTSMSQGLGLQTELTRISLAAGMTPVRGLVGLRCGSQRIAVCFRTKLNPPIAAIRLRSRIRADGGSRRSMTCGRANFGVVIEQCDVFATLDGQRLRVSVVRVADQRAAEFSVGAIILTSAPRYHERDSRKFIPGESHRALALSRSPCQRSSRKQAAYRLHSRTDPPRARQALACRSYVRRM